jgi:hypothetical protein
MSRIEQPQNIPNVDVTVFNSVGTKIKVLDAVRNRRVFGIVNSSSSALLNFYLQPNGAGAPIVLAHEKNANKHDGGSFELNGYNGEVWADGEGYVYHYAQ